MKICFCLQDSYKSIAEAFIHEELLARYSGNLRWVYSGDLTEENLAENLKGIDGMFIATFCDRGIEGKIFAAKFARENKIPLLGICLGNADYDHRICEKCFGIKKCQFCRI